MGVDKATAATVVRRRAAARTEVKEEVTEDEGLPGLQQHMRRGRLLPARYQHRLVTAATQRTWMNSSWRPPGNSILFPPLANERVGSPSTLTLLGAAARHHRRPPTAERRAQVHILHKLGVIGIYERITAAEMKAYDDVFAAPIPTPCSPPSAIAALVDRTIPADPSSAMHVPTPAGNPIAD